MEVGDAVYRESRPLAQGAAAVSDAEGEQRPLPSRCAVRALLDCVWHTMGLILGRRLRQPDRNVGRCIRFADGTSARVYRETVIDRPPPTQPTVLVVCFRLGRVRSEQGHALFRLESQLNTLLFAGFPGLVSKLWLDHDEHGVYRGLYQWDDPDQAVSYVRALGWVLALVSDPGSVHYAVLPALDRDEMLADPSLVDTLAVRPGGWWRPVDGPARPR